MGDHGNVTIRRMGRSDEAWLVEVFDGLSTRSRAWRYLTPVPRLTAAMRDALMDLGEGHVALAALDGDVPIGIGRFVATGVGTAEVALEVVDHRQGQGVGRALLRCLTARAREAGHHRLVATVQPDNAVVVGALRRRGAVLSWREGLVEAVLRAEPGRRADTPRRVG